MGTLTETQRDAIDDQIRERILRNRPQVPMSKIHMASLVDARVSLGLGPDLRYDCPYFRDCSKPFPNTCSRYLYRECPVYNGRLTLDIIDRSLDLESVGLV